MTRKMPSEAVIVTLLAAINFTHILDFVVMMPLGPILMRTFEISAAEFTVMVSAYTWAAGLASLGSAFFIDRFDRKSALLFAYTGFALGTLACGVAPSYGWMVAARALAGFFGGQVGTLVFSLVGDLIRLEHRGRATGRISAAFSLASVLGVPAGLFLTQWLSWHAPFVAISVFSLLIAVVIALVLPPVRSHIQPGHSSFADKVDMILEVVRDRNHQWALLYSAVLMLAAFTVIPLLSPSLVANVGFTEEQLPLTYLVGGVATFFSSQWIGQWSDRKGRHQAFQTIALLSIPGVLILTHLPVVNIYVALAVTTYFMVSTSGRFVPAMALITGSTVLKHRGSFMSLNSAIHNLFAGVAASIGGWLTTQPVPNGPLEGYGRAGLFAAAMTVASIWLAKKVQERS